MSDEPAETTTTTATAATPSIRWWQRVVPVSGIAVLAAFAVVGLLGHDDQIELSTHRRPQEYVELVLTRSPAAVCGPRTVQVEFAVTSHLVDPTNLRWQVAIDPAGPAPAKVRKQGSLPVPPEVTRGIKTRTDAPRRAYDLTITLPGRPELLRVHCDGTKR